MKVFPGARFGILVATRFSHKNGSSYYWYFDCDCGNKDVLKSTSYLYPKKNEVCKKSCGCTSAHKGLDYSIVGKKFGRLTVLSLDRIDDGMSYWFCKCDCGNIVSVRRNSLGATTNSCGCYKKELNKTPRKRNLLTFFGEYIEVSDESGEKFIIDYDDEEKIKGKYWTVKNGYAQSFYEGRSNLLHRVIMNPPENMVVDHINRNTLDNRKENLRICTDHQNVLNKKISKNNKSGYTGVYHNKERWVSVIFYNGKTIHLGTYKNIEDAISARLDAEEKYFGEYAPTEKYDL
jgi:hypothetical protein